MAITRRWQAGCESNLTASPTGENEFDVVSGSITTTATAKTGSLAFKIASLASPSADVVLSATRQIRIGGHWNLQAQAATTGTLVFWRAAGVDLGSVRMVAGDLNLNLGLYDAAGNQQAVVNNIYTAGAYFHLGVDIKIDNAAGWVKVYVDGTEVLSWTGNTGNANIDSVRFGGAATGSGPRSLADTYLDDAYIDDTTGEVAAAVPDRRFAYIIPDGVGNYSQCAPVGSANHWENVDDRPHDSDTTYNEANVLNERDTYTMTTVALPAGWTIAAVIPCLYCKKTDAGTDTEITPTLRESATDDDGTSVDADSSYSLKWERFTTKPSGGAWTQAALDGLEVGFVGTGTF